MGFDPPFREFSIKSSSLARCVSEAISENWGKLLGPPLAISKTMRFFKKKISNRVSPWDPPF